MKYLKNRLYFLLVALFATLISTAQSIDTSTWKQGDDITDFIITNAHFSLNDIVEGGICTYDYDCEKNGIAITNYSMLPLEGWTRQKTDNGAASGVFGIGTNAFLGGTAFLPPTTMPNGSTEGKVLGFITCWNMAVQYTQPVSLPAGRYSFSISYYNSGGTTAIGKNLIGFITDDGVEYLCQQKTFKVGQWIKEKVVVELEKETTGYFSLGYKSANTGSYNMPHLFVDGISLTLGDPEPYAVLSDYNTVLTFYYDNQKEARGGMSIGPFTSAVSRGWDANKTSITSVVFDASFAGCTTLTSTAFWFYGCENLTSVTGINNLNTLNVANMHSMFYSCSRLTSLDLSSFKTDNATNLGCMFHSCQGLTSLDLSSFKTDNVTDLGSMFYGCFGLTSLDLSSFNTDNVTNMSCLFWGCYGLTSLVLTNFYTGSVTAMYSMFDGCSALTSLDLSSFNTDKVTDMSYMFRGCSCLTNLVLSSFNTKDVIDMNWMFTGCSSLMTIYVGDGWNTAKVTDSAYMFFGCTNLVGGKGTTYDSNHIDCTYAHIDGGTSNPGYFTDKNAAADPEPYVVLSNNNTVLTFYYDNQKDARGGMSVGPFNNANERGWENVASAITSVVFDDSFENYTSLTSTRYWFAFCRNLTSITGISNLNTENVTDMGCMFEGCTGLKALDLSGFKTDNARYLDMMFYNCSSLTSLDVSGINTNNVTDMGLMFYSCPGLTSLDLSSFNTNNVTRMDHMFEKCSGLTTIVVSNSWSTAKVAESNDMFTGCTKLVGGRGTTYNANHTDAAYAHIDGGTSNPGYFTAKSSTTVSEPYAVLSDYNTILTFYYDNQKTARGGMSVGPFEDTADRGWNGASETITSVIFDASFAACTSLTSTAYWFNGMKNLTSITGLNNLKTENVTGMMLMFYGCSSLTSLDLSNFNTSNVMVMSDMFFECSSLTSLDLSSFNTSNVTSMSGVFYNCSSLTNLDLSGFNTLKVTDMRYMFSGCSSLTTIVVGDGWSTARVTDSDYMFSRCTKLVGGKGTTYDADHIDVVYAHVDGGTANPGYFTGKNVTTVCEMPQIAREGTSNYIIMSCATAGASIYYTTNGTTPTENNTRYTGPIILSKNCTIKAIAIKDGYESSSVATYNVNWFKVARPTFNYSNLQLNISTATSDATIYYTTNGSTPTTSSTKYTGAISLTTDCTVKAIAVKDDYTNSDVATYSFVKSNYTCQAPQISRNGTGNQVVMTCATSGASIYYTTDGTTPTQASVRYTGAITFDHNQTIRAVAIKDGMFNSSQTQFSVDWFKVATPTFSYSNLQLAISTATSGAIIYYTIDGSNPLADLSKAIRYTVPVRLEADAQVKSVAVKTDFNNSDVASYTFVKSDYTCKQPQIQRDGTTNRLMMSCEEANVVIYYTTDGSIPTTSSTCYTGPVTVAYNCTVRAIATRSDLFPSDVSEFKVNWLSVSDATLTYSNGVLTISYAIQGAEIHYEIGGKDATKSSPLYTGPITLTDNREVRYVVYVTGKEPVSGSYTPTDFTCAPVTLSYDGLNIILSTAEEGATVYYTTDGSIPTTSSEIYRGKISLTGLCTVTAFATKQYKNNSEMMSEPITYFFDGTDVFLSEAGRLGDAVKREKEDIETLNVKCQGSGELNASDFSALRSIKSLKYLNLKDALFENNTVPDGAFANMNVVLIEFPPTETKISRITGNVFSGSNHLAAIVWMAPIKMAQSASALGITNPNLLIYVDNKSFAPQGVRNIVENGSASSIVLTDEGISFWCPQAFTAQRISYTHVYSQTTGINKCSGWETIALPFDVQNITHEDVGRVTPFAANDASPRSFWLGELSESGFKRASEIKAYTPYIISMPNNEVYGNSYILAGRVTFEAYNTTVPVTEIKTTKKGTHEFTPCFDVVNAASSVYAINKYDQSNSYPEGSTFLPNYSDVKPFEAYIAVPTNGVAPRYIPIRDEDTGIENLTPSLFQGEEAAYDLTGRKVQGELQRGVYIINGKKEMVK